MIQFTPTPNSAVLSLGTSGVATSKAARPTKATVSRTGGPSSRPDGFGGPLRAIALPVSRFTMQFSATFSAGQLGQFDGCGQPICAGISKAINRPVR